MPVGELQARWTSREFAELLAFEAAEPDDAARTEQAVAILAAVLARCLGGEVEAQALVPDYWAERGPAPGRRRQSPAEIAAVASLFAGIYNQAAAAAAKRGRA